MREYTYASLVLLVPPSEELGARGEMRGLVASLIRRASSDLAGKLLRPISGDLARNCSTTTATTTPETPDDGAVPVKKKWKKKKTKNLFEVAQFLPNWGLGYGLAKNHWKGVFYKITKINLYKDGSHGKAWGIFYKDGLPTSGPARKISGVHKRGWRYVPQSLKLIAASDNVKDQKETEVQA